MLFRLTICTIFLAVLALPTIINADDIVPLSYPPKVAYMLLANELGVQYGIPSSEIKNVLKAESGYSQEAVGDHGKALSCAQFHKDTFDGYAAQYGQPLNYPSCIDQEKLMAWMWASNPQTTQLWTTYRRSYGVKYRHEKV